MPTDTSKLHAVAVRAMHELITLSAMAEADGDATLEQEAEIARRKVEDIMTYLWAKARKT